MTAAEMLRAAADTFEERNAVYKDNHVVVGEVMAALFPEGIVLRTPADFQHWHLFELMVVKLTRFAKTDRCHTDSLRDISVYAAILESLL